MASVIPFLYADLNRSWCTQLVATDVQGDSLPQLGGVAVTLRSVDERVARSLGQISEKWRYDVEDAIAARVHAMHVASSSLAIDTGACGLLGPCEVNNLDTPPTFNDGAQKTSKRISDFVQISEPRLTFGQVVSFVGFPGAIAMLLQWYCHVIAMATTWQ